MKKYIVLQSAAKLPGGFGQAVAKAPLATGHP